MCFYWSRAMISRDRHRIAPHKTDLTCMANGIPVIFGTVHVSKFQNVSVNKTTCLMLFSLYKINR